MELGFSVHKGFGLKTSSILDLWPDRIQIPFHFLRPDPDICRFLADHGVRIRGKFIPSNLRDAEKQAQEVFLAYKDIVYDWDIGGEPETRSGQPGCRFPGSPEEFVKTIHIFRNVGKATNENNIIGGCGWISATFNGMLGNEDRSQFFAECCDLGILDLLDFVSINCFLFGYGGLLNAYCGIGKIREILAGYQFDKPLTVAEFGVPCKGDPGFYHIVQSPRDQAISLIRQAVIFASLKIQLSVWFSFQHTGWGLLDESGGLRSSFHAFRTLAWMLKDTEYLTTFKACPTDPNDRWFTDFISWHVFRRYRRDVHVLWNSSPSMFGCLMSSNVKAVGYLGNPISLSKDRVIFLGKEPVYVLAKQDELNQENFLRTNA